VEAVVGWKVRFRISIEEAKHAAWPLGRRAGLGRLLGGEGKTSDTTGVDGEGERGGIRL
jgi:hypothetical protein